METSTLPTQRNQSSDYIAENVFYRKSTYNDNDGNVIVTYSYNPATKSIGWSQFDGYNSGLKEDSVNRAFSEAYESEIKQQYISDLLEDSDLQKAHNYGVGVYGVAVTIKGSRKCKNGSGTLIEIVSCYNSYSFKNEQKAKVQDSEGNISYISPSCVSVPKESILFLLDRIETNNIVEFGRYKRDNLFHF